MSREQQMLERFRINVTETEEELRTGAWLVTIKVKFGHTLCAAEQLHEVLVEHDQVSMIRCV